MKKFICLFILVIALVVLSGCTQPAAPAEPVTTAPTTIPIPESTPVMTMRTTVQTTISPTVLPTMIAAVHTTVPINPAPVVTTIHIINKSFVPSELTVLPGTGVFWVNDDSVIHSVKATGSAAGKFNSGDIIPGSRFDYTFGNTDGRFEFASTYYPSMTGVIIVKKSDAIPAPLQNTSPSK